MTLDLPSRAGDFTPNQFTAFDIEPDRRFEPDELAKNAVKVIEDRAGALPIGPTPIKGHRGSIKDARLGAKTREGGYLGAGREITGMKRPRGGFPIDGD